MTSREVCLDGGSPWGFRMHGGVDVNQPLRISRVNPGSKAALRGIREGDLITSINGQSTKDISNAEAHNLLRNAGEILKLGLNEDISGSPKRRQYRTVHQETHSETIKRSTVTTYSIKSSKTTEDIETTTQDVLKQTSDSKICPLNNITSQRSTISTNCSSSPSTLSDLAGNLKSSSHETNILERSPPPYNNTNPTSPSSIITEVGNNGSNSLTTMADSATIITRSQKRRARKKARKLQLNQTFEQNNNNNDITTPTIIKSIEEDEHIVDYRVDSPETVQKNEKKNPMVKSRSLDDDNNDGIVKIQELHDDDDDVKQNDSSLSTLSLILDDQPNIQQVTIISPEDELKLRNFLEGLNLCNSPEDAIKQKLEKSTSETIKQQRAKKRLALEQYFMPMMENPRYLDVISEETSDFSDREQPNLTRHLKQGTPELETKPPVPKTKKITKKSTTNKPPNIHHHVTAVAEVVCSASVVDGAQGVEVVYLDDSSSSDSNSDNEETLNVSKLETNNIILNELTPPPTPDENFQQNNNNNNDNITCDTVFSNVISSPPVPSRSPSSDGSSSHTLSTAKYNPNASIADIQSICKDDEEFLTKDIKLFNPLTLREICINFLLTLPFGIEMLQELADVSSSIDNLTNNLPSQILPKIAPSLPHFTNNNNNSNNTHKSVNNNIPLDKMDNKEEWMINDDGIEIEKNSNLLSPIQQIHLNNNKYLITRNETDNNNLLDLDEKDQMRCISEEDNTRKLFKEDTLDVCKVVNNQSGCDRLLAIIQNEPSPCNSIAYNNNNITPSKQQHHQDVNEEENCCGAVATSRLKAKNLSEWLELAREKSMMCDRNVNMKKRRSSLPQELYKRQMIYIEEKEREIQRELERLEEEKLKLTSEMAASDDNIIETRQFQPNDYVISRRGDYAIHNEGKLKIRPISMPTEFFRQQMYEEYMNEIAEREERKHNKVIKLSNLSEQKTDCDKKFINTTTTSTYHHVIDVENEFMQKVKEKQKQGILERKSEEKIVEINQQQQATTLNSNDNEVNCVLVIDGNTVKKGITEQLPKHLQEFVDITNSTSDGVWSPGQKPEPIKRPEELIERPKETPEDESSPQAPVWTPKSANSSPTVERKEFRPVNFQSPKLERKQFKTTNGDNNTNLSGKSIEPPWKFDGQALEKRLTTSQSSPASGFSDISPSPRLPKAQNPTITLLQKAREGQLPKGAHYLEQQQSHFERRFPNERPALANPGDVLYKIKNEYTSESDSERPRKMADLGPRKYDGIGPTTKNGMPLTLRSEVKDANQSKWYKRMYDTIHKPKLNKDEYVTVRYKQRRALYPYTSGYLSEPEPGAYDSDYTDYKYATLDRRRQPLTERSNEYLTNAAPSSSSTMPRNLPNKSSSSSDIVRNSQGIYKNQPGRIENYMPGHSSISEKEAKEWWDEVMDIFDGWLDDNSPVPSYDYLFAKALARSQMEQQKRIPQTKSFINQALKESGYESDSTLIFRRKEEAAQQLSPSEQKEAYKAIQKGGDVPLHGLRKPAPERPKDEQIEYFPISPTLTRIRIHKNVIQPQREILCYPVTVHYNTSNKFRDYKRTAPSSININEATTATSPPPPPPSPPKRKSSRNNSTLRLISTMKVKTSNEKSPLCKRHETCFTTTTSNVDKTKVKYLRDKLTCKLTTKKKNDSPKIKVFKTISTTTPNVKSKIITSTLTTTKNPNTLCRKVQSKTNNIKSTETSKVKSSLAKKPATVKPNESTNKPSTSSRLNSPLLRTFGSEKRKCELTLTKSSSSVSPRRKLSKTPDLLSPIEVKKAVENATNGITYKKSNILTKNGASLPIKVGISDKARSIIKPTIRSASVSPKLTKKKFTSSQSSLSTRTKSSLESLNSPKMNRKPRELVVEQKKLQKPKKDKINDEIRKTKKDERSKSPVEIIVKNPTLDNIQKQKQVIETNHFFRNLFLRNISPTPSNTSRNSWLIEKTQQLNLRRRSSIPEPSIGAMKVYLKHTRPVSDSKFLSLDMARSRSASPKSVSWQEPFEKPTKRSSSLPSKIIFSQTSRPISPSVIYQRTPSPSPSICRSPSSRRITQFRHTNDNIKGGNYNKIEKRGGAPPLSIYMCPNLNQSTSSLESFENHEYQTYIKELLHSSRKCSKFQDLNHFYADIEKVGQLEQRFNVKPRKKCENEIVDYDRWQEVRSRERAEQQLNNLYTQLKQNEKDKGFLFTPIDVKRQKWRRELDRGLRIKEKSVENIKDEFEKLKEYDWNLNRHHLIYNKDTYKPLWRGNSVVNLAQILTERRSQSEGRLPSSTPSLKYRQMDDEDDDKLLTRRIGSRIWSSLLMEQVNLLKEQLTEIYSGNLSKETIKNNNDCTIHVTENNKEKYLNNLIVRRNSDTDVPCKKNEQLSSIVSMSETDKKFISNSLSKEVIDKIMKKRDNNKQAIIVGKEVRGAVASQQAQLKQFNNEDVKPKKPLIKLDVSCSPNKSTSETESGSTDESTKTVIYVPKEEIKKKVEYFEKASEFDKFVPTIYKPADENYDNNNNNKLVRSESCQNIKEYFGEHDLHKFATIPLSATKREQCNTFPTKPQLRALSPIKTASSISEATSYDSLCRSRSISPYLVDDNNISKDCCFNNDGGGEVQRLKHKFEDYNNELLRPRRSKSDSDLNKFFHNYNTMYNYGYVDDLRRKYEYPALSGRGRSRTRRGGVVSPIFLRAEDRFMPHINIISKIARLYSNKKHLNNDGTVKTEKNIKELARIFDCPMGVVEKLIEKYENAQNISLVGQMYTSSPNLKEIRDISPYLTASWTAHRYPKSEDNTRSLSTPEKSIGSRDTSLVCRRAKSTSPIRTILKHKQEKNVRNDVKKRQDDAVRYKTWWTATNSRPSVSFKEPEPPVPPPKSQHTLRNLQQESPRKYVENQVTIHYKTPVRQEIKECLSEDELAHRQAEVMKKIYQEERRRKYLQVSNSLQELQDMNSRRHTDNFIPSQKSPIPLNRYDDFEVVTTPVTKPPPPRSPEPRLVARALYNFVGQTARELTFRKGDLIYVRRQVDKNWYEGELNAMVGLFPVNYVEIVHHNDGGIRTPQILTQRKSHEGQARAKYNFVAQTHLELSLAKGELVIITRKVDDNWFEGKIGGRKGIFPISYVEVLIDPQDPQPISTKPVASPAAHSLLHNGTAGGKESMGSHLYTPNLPATTPSTTNSYHAKPVQIDASGTYSTLNRNNPVDQALHIDTQSEPIPYRALYKYKPQNDDELELFEGDIVYVLEKCDDGWYVGSSERTGAFGTFPGNYVEKI